MSKSPCVDWKVMLTVCHHHTSTEISNFSSSYRSLFTKILLKSLCESLVQLVGERQALNRE